VTSRRRAGDGDIDVFDFGCEQPIVEGSARDGVELRHRCAHLFQIREKHRLRMPQLIRQLGCAGFDRCCLRFAQGDEFPIIRRAGKRDGHVSCLGFRC